MDTSATNSAPLPDQTPTAADRGDGNPGPDGTYPRPTGEQLDALGPNPTDAQLVGFHAPGQPGVPSEFWEKQWLLGRQIRN